MRSSKTFPKLGEDVSITFIDHCQDGESVVHCTVRGVIVNITEIEICVESWTTHEDNSPHNRTRFCIVRSTITSIIIKEALKIYESPKKTTS